ncbi:MAG TPA: SDR family NAD(P)-dependent oxidoreductase [Streptosporangiaceae bacterium]|nr:SDR family NAD(P)-dependent oxidoreductase [Streptosporangiaceae bacterium]
MRDLSGKVAVVTGAASGIGLALSRRLGADGMRVMMADVEEPALEAAARSLADEGIETAAAVTDVSDAAAVDALARATLGRFGAVHVVCNNAGVAGGGLSWQVPAPVWDWIVGVNLFGVVHGIRSFVPHLIAQGEGHVVNTASVAGLLGSPGLSAYCATKHAVVGLSETLAHDLAAVGSPVGVSVLCPGFVRTRIAEADRNWPARYGAPPSTDDQPGADEMRQAIAGAIESGLDPAAVAEAVRDAIVAGRFWVLTHPEFNDAIVGRYREAVGGGDPGTAVLG